MPKGGTGTIGGPRIGGPAVSGRSGPTISKAFISGSKEAGGAGGPAAAKFSIANALESSPLRAGLNKSNGSEKMTVIAGQPVVRRPGPAEFARTPNIGSERFTNRVQFNPQRRPAEAPERHTAPDASGKQIDKALGVKTGEFNPSAPKGRDIIQRGNGRYRLPPESTAAHPPDTRVQQAELLRKIRIAHAEGPKQVELSPKTAQIQTSPVKEVEVRPKVAVTPAGRPQSPDISRIMAELGKISERTKKEASNYSGSLVVGPMAEYQNLDRKVVTLKKEAEKRGVSKTPVEQALGLLNKRQESKIVAAAGIKAQSSGNPYEAIRALIRKRIHVEEEKKQNDVKKVEAKVIQLRPTDPVRQPALQTEQTNGRLAPAIGLHRPAEAKVNIKPAVIDVPQPVRAEAVTARANIADVQPQPAPNEQGNVIYLANRNKAEVPGQRRPDIPPEDDPEEKQGRYSLAEQVLQNRIAETTDGLEELSRHTKNGLVSGEQIYPYLTNGEKTSSPIVAPGSDMSNKLRINETRSLAPAAPEVIRARVISINRARRPAKRGVGPTIGNDELRIILGNQPLEERRRVA